MIHNTIKLALTLPGQTEAIPTPPGLGSKGFAFNNLGDFVTALYSIIVYVSVFLAFYYLIWGAYQYLLSDGKKEDLAKARARITWALIGLIIVLLSFLIAKYAANIFVTPANLKGIPF